MITRVAQRTALAAWLLLRTVDALALGVGDRSPLVNGPDLQFPSVGRVLFAFALVGGVAVLLIFVLKKMKPWLSNRGIGVPAASQIALISHRKLSRTLNIYLIDAEQQRFMIVQSSHSTVVTKLENVGIDVTSA